MSKQGIEHEEVIADAGIVGRRLARELIPSLIAVSCGCGGAFLN